MLLLHLLRLLHLRTRTKDLILTTVLLFLLVYFGGVFWKRDSVVFYYLAIDGFTHWLTSC